MPGWIFFSQRGGFSFVNGLDFKNFNLVLFPLVGLYAFTLVWLQVVIGSARSMLRKIFPGVITWHRRQGVFVLLFAILHPTLLFLGVGPAVYFSRTYVAPSLVPYIWLGYVQLFLIILTASTALLRKVTWLQKRWHTIHYLNYLVFILVWIHSWFLGSDVQTTNLKYLWWFFALTAAAGTAVRVQDVIRRKRRREQASSEQTRQEA
jgi:DMSO/TMAO reductase YedYZ heme-binding membrane subunit